MKKYLSKYFKIISEKPDSVEIKSVYHYWRIISRDGLYFLHHKHSVDNTYHVQSRIPFTSLRSIRKYIAEHDKYVKNRK